MASPRVSCAPGGHLSALLLLLAGCKSASPTPSIETDTDTDTDVDSDADADADADSDADADTDSDADTDTGTTCSEDALEPNDTFLSASPLASHTDLWVRLGAPDVFFVTQPAGTLLTVEVTHDWAQGDIDVYIVEPDGLAVGTSGATVADIERATACNPLTEPTQRYVYVEIWEASLDTCNTYDLAYTLTPDACTPPDTGVTPTGDTGTSSTGDTGGSTGHTGTAP